VKKATGIFKVKHNNNAMICIQMICWLRATDHFQLKDIHRYWLVTEVSSVNMIASQVSTVWWCRQKLYVGTKVVPSNLTKLA